MSSTDMAQVERVVRRAYERSRWARAAWGSLPIVLLALVVSFMHARPPLGVGVRSGRGGAGHDVPVVWARRAARGAAGCPHRPGAVGAGDGREPGPRLWCARLLHLVRAGVRDRRRGGGPGGGVGCAPARRGPALLGGGLGRGPGGRRDGLRLRRLRGRRRARAGLRGGLVAPASCSAYERSSPRLLPGRGHACGPSGLVCRAGLWSSRPRGAGVRARRVGGRRGARVVGRGTRRAERGRGPRTAWTSWCARPWTRAPRSPRCRLACAPWDTRPTPRPRCPPPSSRWRCKTCRWRGPTRSTRPACTWPSCARGSRRWAPSARAVAPRRPRPR
jgi:hypothetical protein